MVFMKKILYNARKMYGIWVMEGTGYGVTRGMGF